MEKQRITLIFTHRIVKITTKAT